MSKTIYYACKYAPLELFAGYGATFSALDPLAESFSCAERCAHANLCGYAKAVLEQVEQSGIRALVLTNCCDAMLRVYDVLAASGKMEFLQLLPVPHQSTPATRARFARDLRRLADALQRYTGQEFDAQRAHAFFVHKPHAEGPHLTLLGAHGGSVLYDTVQKAFALPVVDATCTGNRELADVAPAALEDFLPGYAAALLGQMPCMRMDAPVSERAALVDGQTVGIVYHTVQFCDYYAPGLTAPEQFHLPVLKIETDCSPPDLYQRRRAAEHPPGRICRKPERRSRYRKQGGPRHEHQRTICRRHRQRLCQHRCRDPGSQRKDLRLGHCAHRRRGCNRRPPGTGTGPDDGRHCRKRPGFQGIHRLRARVPGR